jgi:hypothetical protein
MTLKEKYKNIPTQYYVVYAIGSVNVFLGVFLSFYYRTFTYFQDSPANYVLALLILIYFIRLTNKANSFIDYELKEEVINKSRLWWSLMFKLFLTTSFVLFVIYPVLESEFQLKNKISAFLIKGIPTASPKMINAGADLVGLILTAGVAWIVSFIQSTLGSIIYDFLIKPRIEAWRKKSSKPKSRPKKQSQ